MEADFKVPDLKWPKGTRWVKLPSGRLVGEMLVEPALATAMLALNADNQRGRKSAAIARYATDMSSGSWRLTHQGIAFNRKGLLHDGQNRLAAVVESGVAVPMTVWLGAGADQEMTVIDTNAPRSVRDAANVVRLDIDHFAVSTLLASVRYGVLNGGALLNAMTHSAKLAALKRHMNTLSEVAEWFGNTKLARKLGTAVVRAAVVCAAQTLDHVQLARFVQVVTEQEDPKAGEGVAKTLRAYLVSQAPNTPPREVFLKTCRAILHFVDREDAPRLYACADNPFPFILAN